MKVFVDASALVPFALERDQWALPLRRALRALRELGQPELITANWTYYEALALCRRSGMHTVSKLRRMVDSEVAIVPVAGEDEAKALRRILSRDDKTASVIDHANLLVALRQGCAAILSFDDDFLPIAQGTGVRVLR
ncbi:MAG: PIN domain-containing protein [bacterium]